MIKQYKINTDGFVDIIQDESIVEGFTEYDDANKPKAVTDRLLEINNKFEAAQYQRDRAAAYPAVQDQLDNIYHNGIAGWKATIKAVKDANPKPV
jgi:hypothetical protein